MVRVISVHHFTRQDVAGLDRAGGRGVASGNGDILLIGGEHRVDIRNLKLGGVCQGSFPTVDLVQQLVYCQTGNYVCTLENKPARHGGDHTYVRVYLHWEKEQSNQPMRARIAGRVTPSSQSGVDNLEMVEIPLRKPADFIACCQTTGNVAVSSGMTVTIFKFCMKTHDISKMQFIDFEELIEIDVAFIIKEVAISEDVIGCIAEKEAHVFQITLRADLRKSESTERDLLLTRRSKSRSKSKSRSLSKSPRRSLDSKTPSGRLAAKGLNAKEESSSIIRDADDFVDLEELEWIPTSCYGRKPRQDDSRFLLFPSLVGAAQCGTVHEPGETIGPISSTQCSVVRIRFMNSSSIGSSQKIISNIFEAVTLIYRRTDVLNDPDVPFSNLKVTSVYEKIDPNKVASSPRPSANPLLSSTCGKRVGASLFLTSPHIGHLYHVTLANDPNKSSVVRGGVFSYTATLYSVALEPSLLHALTLTGLETYTLRPHPYIVSAHLPEDFSMIVPPHWEETVCLVGLRPFLNIECLSLTDSCLALIAANNEGGDKSHTLYALHLPSAGSLYKEMVRVGRSHRSASSSTYLHLLLEAYLVLTTALHREDLGVEVQEVTEEDQQEEDLQALLQDSAALLADFYTECENEVEWRQAVQYYQVSSLTPDAVIERVPEEAPGLVPVILSLLLHPNAPVLSAGQANCILEVLEKVAPDKVATVVLQAPCFTNYKKDKVLNIIKHELANTQEPRPTDVLALAMVVLEKGLPEQVASVLTSLRMYQLVEVLLQYPKLVMTTSEGVAALTPLSQVASVLTSLRMYQLVEVLLQYPKLVMTTSEGVAALTPLSQVLAEHKKEVFTEVFVSLIGSGSLTLNEFVDAFIAAYPIVSCGLECNTHSLRLRDFIETFFLEYAHNTGVTDQRDGYDRAVSVLVSLYLATLMGAFKDEGQEDVNDQRTALTELYSPRPTYLNLLPPFNGASPTSRCLLRMSRGVKKEEERADKKDQEEKGDGKNEEVVERNKSGMERESGIRCTCSRCCLHLLVLQSLLSSNLPSGDDRANVLKFAKSNPTSLGAKSLQVLCLSSHEKLEFLLEESPRTLLQFGKDTYRTSIEWEDLVVQLIGRKSSLPDDDPEYAVYAGVLSNVLSHLVQTAPLEVFLRIIPTPQHEEFKSHIRLKHSAALAENLKNILVTYANNVLQQMAK